MSRGLIAGAYGPLRTPGGAVSIPNGSGRNRRVLPTRDHPSIPFTAPQLYKAFEGKIGTAGDLDAMMADLEAEQRNDLDKKRVFAYRGVANANHAFFSSLYRRLWWTEAAKAGRTIATHHPPTEYALAAAEDRILVELHRWGSTMQSGVASRFFVNWLCYSTIMRRRVSSMSH
jgi:hypothetical protein